MITTANKSKVTLTNDRQRFLIQNKSNSGGISKLSDQCGSCGKNSLLGFQNKIPVRSDNEDLSGNYTGMPSTLKSGLESLSGVDFSSVKVYFNSAKPAQVNALAYTQGQNIYLGPGQEKHLAHEGWHVVQQMQGRVTPTLQTRGFSINDDTDLEKEADTMGGKVLKESEIVPRQLKTRRVYMPSQAITQRLINYIVQTTQRAWLQPTPGSNEGIRENLVEVNASQAMVERGTDLELLNSNQDWIEVRGKASFSRNLSPGSSTGVAPTEMRTGWIRRNETNLAPASNAVNENMRVAQDLDNILDAEILPAMLHWESGVRTQGQAYASAYQEFSDTLVQASQQAKARADFYAAILTSVSVGALGWIGEAAKNSSSLTRIFQSETLRGSIEDAIQTGVGESIDILQGGWFTQHINSETHPLQYLNGALRALVDTKADLISHVGTTKTRIGRTVELIDRAGTLVEIFRWWETAKVRHTPNITLSDQQPMAREFERGFWAQYIKEDLTEISTLRRYYNHPESAVQARLDQLNISSEAGIDDWDSWYERTNDIRRIRRPPGYGYPTRGSTWTRKLYRWAAENQPTTFD